MAFLCKHNDRAPLFTVFRPYRILVAIRQIAYLAENRPFTSTVELWEVIFRACAKMYIHSVLKLTSSLDERIVSVLDL